MCMPKGVLTLIILYIRLYESRNSLINDSKGLIPFGIKMKLSDYASLNGILSYY